MAAKSAADDILQQLEDAATSITKQQTAFIERYSDLIRKLLKGNLKKTDIKSFAEFWLGEASDLARNVTDLNVAYFKAVTQVGERLSTRLEKMSKKKATSSTKTAASSTTTASRGKPRSRPRATR